MKGELFVELIRHGMTRLGEERRYQGRLDPPLSEGGRADLLENVREVRHLYVSPAVRAKQTAEILFPGAQMTVVPGLAEIDFGDFEGRTADEMQNDAAYRAWVDSGCETRCPGGEIKEEFTERAASAFESVMKEAAVRGEEEIVIVAHGGTMMAILSRFGRPERPYFSWGRPCGCGYRLKVREEEGHRRVLDVLEETSYIRGGGQS